MRVREVLLGLEDVDPESDCRVWADGMRVITTRYGAPVERGLHVVSRFHDDDIEIEEEEPMPHTSLGFRRLHYTFVKPKWKLPEATFVQTPSGLHGLTNVVHYFDQDESTLEFRVDEETGAFGPTRPVLRAWCGLRSVDPRSVSDRMAPENRLCLTCERKFDEWHTACEGCGVIKHNDDMAMLGGDRETDNGLEAYPAECNDCFAERERVEAPYRRVMLGSA